MKKPVLAIVLLTLAASASARGMRSCAAPDFPPYSPTTESARDVEKQVLRWRACHGMNARRMDPVVATQRQNEVEENLQKWADATRIHLAAQRSAYQPHVLEERQQQTELLTRLMPARSTYSAERR